MRTYRLKTVLSYALILFFSVIVAKGITAFAGSLTLGTFIRLVLFPIFALMALLIVMQNWEQIWVGANKYVSDQDFDVKMHEYDPMIQEKQVEKLNKVKKERDNAKVETCLKELRKAAESNVNIMPATLEAVKAYATVGEMAGVLREVFGEFKEPVLV